MNTRRIFAIAVVAVGLAACGGGGGSAAAPVPFAFPTPSGKIILTIPGTTSLASFTTNFAHGSSVAFAVSEASYIGSFSVTVASPIFPTGSVNCIAVSPATLTPPATATFTVTTSGSPCLYPQTADIQVQDGAGNSAFEIVQAQ